MSTDETYNGWTNRETWAVVLHINNDQGWQESVHEAIRNMDELGEWLDIRDGMSDATAARYAGEAIRENVEDLFDPDVFSLTDSQRDTYTISSDLRAVREDIGSLWRVDWTELGAAFLADLAEQDQ